jgi:hypothetical protein
MGILCQETIERCRKAFEEMDANHNGSARPARECGACCQGLHHLATTRTFSTETTDYVTSRSHLLDGQRPRVSTAW